MNTGSKKHLGQRHSASEDISKEMKENLIPKMQIHNGKFRAEISPLGGQVVLWQELIGINESGEELWQDLLYRGKTQKRSGVPVLFPFADDMPGDELNISGGLLPRHGFARNLPWELEQVSESECLLTLSSENCQEDALVLAYPWDFTFVMQVSLSPDGELSYVMGVQNEDDEPMPIAPGLHPYFPVKHSDKSLIKVESKQGEFNLADKINLESVMDGGLYTDFEEEATITFNTDEEGEKSLVISNPDSEFEKLVIWTQPSPMEDCDFICFEPFARERNGININPILIEPGQIWQSELNFRWVK
jgi:galactose mutarotase-like enzyme